MLRPYDRGVLVFVAAAFCLSSSGGRRAPFTHVVANHKVECQLPGIFPHFAAERPGQSYEHKHG